MGGPEVIILGLFLLPLIAGIGTAVSASHFPDWAFERAGSSKTLWIVLPLVGMFLCGIVAIVTAIVWFSTTKARVVAATGGVGTPPPPPPYA